MEIRKEKELSNDDQDIWIYFLTLENIKTLEKSGRPTIGDWNEAEKAISFFKIPWIQIELKLGLATTFIEFAIFLSAAYFLIFLREAKHIPNFFAAGTLIGAMRRDRFTVFLILLFMFIPIVASQKLAFSSLHASKIFNLSVDWIFAHLTLVFYFLAVQEIWRARHFKQKG
jgi:hypothetical protein